MMVGECVELSDQEEVESRNQSKLRKRQALACIEEEYGYQEDIEDER